MTLLLVLKNYDSQKDCNIMITCWLCSDKQMNDSKYILFKSPAAHLSPHYLFKEHKQFQLAGQRSSLSRYIGSAFLEVSVSGERHEVHAWGMSDLPDGGRHYTVLHIRWPEKGSTQDSSVSCFHHMIPWDLPGPSHKHSLHITAVTSLTAWYE